MDIPTGANPSPARKGLCNGQNIPGTKFFQACPALRPPSRPEVGGTEGGLTMRHDIQATAQIISDLRFRRKVKELHAKGPRITAELVAEVIAVPDEVAS